MATLGGRHSQGLDREMDASKLSSSSVVVVVVVIVVAGSQVEDMMTTSGTLSLNTFTHSLAEGGTAEQKENKAYSLEHRARNRNPSITMRAGRGDERPEHSHDDKPKKREGRTRK